MFQNGCYGLSEFKGHICHAVRCVPLILCAFNEGIACLTDCFFLLPHKGQDEEIIEYKEEKRIEDMTEEERIAELGRPRMGDINKITCHIRESMEFKVSHGSRIINNAAFVLYCIGIFYIALHCIALYCIALHCIALHCIALHCIALHCIALHCIGENCLYSNKHIFLKMHTHGLFGCM